MIHGPPAASSAASGVPVSLQKAGNEMPVEFGERGWKEPTELLQTRRPSHRYNPHHERNIPCKMAF